MATTSVTPYGEWTSPISAAALTAAARRLATPALVEDETWWAEDRPAEGGRTTVLAHRGGEIVELLPAPWNARSRVHEYGGRAFLPVPGPDGPGLVFVHLADQRLYRLDPGAGTPVPLTPAPEPADTSRYADLVLIPGQTEPEGQAAPAHAEPAQAEPEGQAAPAQAEPARPTEVWCVRERHRGDQLDRHVVAVPLDGRAGSDPAAVREVAGGSRFLAHPRLSPDGTRLAWLAWDHPNMPWDGTELRVGRLDPAGTVDNWTTVLGGRSESVFQPEWDGRDHLIVASDRDGWWNLFRVPAAGGEPTGLYPAAEEFGAPLWQLGMATWGRLADGRLLCCHGAGTQRLGVLDPATGTLTDLDLPYHGYAPWLSVAGDTAAVLTHSPSRPAAVVRIDVPAGQSEEIRPAVDPADLPDPAYLPVPESTTLPGPEGREVYAHIYPPRNPQHVGPDGQPPPYVVFVHGGPTGNSPAMLDLTKAYFTSRGLGVLDVEYGGSTGYGRAYRERLTGRWGEVDVADVAAAASALAARGDADPARLAIRGGSAGGYTALCAVTGTDVFAAGTSRYGVADLARLAEITHDFESRYLVNLAGEAALTDGSRSPLTHAHRTRCPVLLLQGSDDPIVPLEQAEQFRDALAAAGVRHALLVFDGEQHGFRKAESIVAAIEAELSFYGQVLGFTPSGVPPLPLSG